MPHSPFKNPHFHDLVRQKRTRRAITRHIRRSYMRRKTRPPFRAPARVTKSTHLLQLSRRFRAHPSPKPKYANRCQQVPNRAIKANAQSEPKLPHTKSYFQTKPPNPISNRKTHSNPSPRDERSHFRKTNPSSEVRRRKTNSRDIPDASTSKTPQTTPQLSKTFPTTYPVAAFRLRPL